MKTLLATFILSILVAVTLTPLVRRFAKRIGAVDKPEKRRVNTTVVPRLGGISILFGFLAPLVGLMLYTNRISDAFNSDQYRVLALFGGSIAISLLGAIDDIRNVRAIYKLLVQIMIATGAYLGGFQINLITLPFVGVLHMGIFGLPVTIFWIVGIINAVNLIDGLDGLAAGVSFFVCIVNFVIGLLSNNILVSVYAASLGGALVGFLIFNFNPATIFMGDTGSMLIGYILATTSLIGTKGGTAVALLVPILAMGVPIVDTLLAISRRYMQRRPIFSPDKEHLHHKLLDMGLTHKKTVLVIYGISILFTAVSIAIYMSRKKWEVGVALLISSILIFVMMRAVGMFQLRRSKELELPGEYDEITNSIKGNLPKLIVDIHQSMNLKELETAIERFGDSTGLTHAQCMRNNEHLFNYWCWVTYAGKRLPEQSSVTISHSILARCNSKKVVYDFKFGWRSDNVVDSQNTELLLRIVADAIIMVGEKFFEEESFKHTNI